MTERHINPHRPYARKRKWGPSITTILENKAVHLEWGASKEAALYAVNNMEEWANLHPDDAVDKIRRRFRGVWDGRAGMGTLIHAINEAWSLGHTADTREEIDKILAAPKPPKIWMGREHEVVEEAEPYIDGLEKFWRDNNPETVASEEVVHYPHPELAYIGQRDWVVRIGGRLLLVEIKTTAQQDYKKALYFDSWRLQLAAQRFATRLLFFDADNNVIAEDDNYPVDGCAVLHFRGDGGYQFFEVEAGEKEWGYFLTLRRFHEWCHTDHKHPAPTILGFAEPTVFTLIDSEGAA